MKYMMKYLFFTFSDQQIGKKKALFSIPKKAKVEWEEKIEIDV